MANNPYANKIIFGNEVKLDLTSDTVERSDVLAGKTFHLPTGEQTTGTCAYDADTSDATAGAADILATKTAYVDGNKVTGNMPNRGAVTGSISNKNTPYNIQNGYHDGSGTVGIDSTESAKIIAENIKDGVEILGVTGTYTGEGVPTEEKNVTPYTTPQTILPTTGYNISQVNVAAIAYVETDNAAGGKTVTIGTVAPVSP